MNYHASYTLEIRPTETGQFYSVIHERDSGDQLWESRLYETAQDAWDFGWYEWQARASQDEEAACLRREQRERDGGGVSEQAQCASNGVRWS